MLRPSDVEEAVSLLGEGARARAGNTGAASALAAGADVVDLTGVAGLRGVRPGPEGSVQVGAATTVAELAQAPGLARSHPALVRTAAALATPEVRESATVGGNLLQRNRCAYLRDPAFSCLQDGGRGCPARSGDHPRGVVVDSGGCVEPHPSSLAVALLAQEATVEVASPGGRRSVDAGELYASGEGAGDHVLGPDEVVVSVHLPGPAAGERVGHLRAAARSRAEWPLVEAVVRLGVSGGVVGHARVAVGAVARVPLRLPQVEQALVGARPGQALDERAERALEGVRSWCAPLPQTGYKVALLGATVRGALEEALADPGR
ncbi:FAD binding domain-containing protein [Nocardiopsis xinjiangensis]|uniref:FAD binding domain-containing protein n=1 Tax=Nocardiopsis xinjiangensis TaxID=124285 RepID=UPI000A06FCE7|nr:FAD binding domain-containing protein [Nocardiopsis xinjiangensis]